MNEAQGTVADKEEKRLIMKARLGEAVSLEILVQKYSPLINSLASRFYLGSNSLLSREELIQSGYVGLLMAIQRYDMEKNNTLGTYALLWILGEMRRSVRLNTDQTGCYEQIMRLRRTQAAFEKEYERSPSAVELSQACGIPLWETAALLNAALADRYEEHADCLDTLSSERTDENMVFRHVEIKFALDSINKEEQQVILLRFYRDKSQAETARIIGKSQAQISRIERQAIEHLKKMLT